MASVERLPFLAWPNEWQRDPMANFAGLSASAVVAYQSQAVTPIQLGLRTSEQQGKPAA